MNYFKPWGRKFGVVTLVMALVAMGGWVRSFGIADYASFVAFGTFNRVCIYEGYITWCRDYDLATMNSDNLQSQWTSHRIEGLMIKLPPTANALSFLHNRDIGFQVNRLGFGFGTMADNGHVEQRVAVFHFWSIVVPLTLLSAWLLLKKSPANRSRRKLLNPFLKR